MVQFNTRANEILLKLVYYGPGLSGKTTNLQSLHAMCTEASRGEMFSVNTQEDRTLFFDLLPINLGYIYGNSIHLQIYTVPGQVQYDASRRVVLSGADGVVFVADSSESKMQENVDSLSNLYHNLNANRLNIKQIPFIIQFNKRDLPDAMPVGVMNRRLNFRNVPYFESVAFKGTGVLETFLAVVRDTVGSTFRKYHLDKKIKDFDELLATVDSNIQSCMKELPKTDEPIPKPAGTVLKHAETSVSDLPSDKGADPQDLLEDALKSNMETARLYSELKQASDALNKKNEELGQLHEQIDKANQDNLRTRRYLEGLIQSVGEAIVSFGGDGRILTWNAAAERIFGFSRTEIMGRSIQQLLPPRFHEELERVVLHVSNGSMIRDLPATALRQNGQEFSCGITFSPVRGADDRVLACSAVVRDLSQQGQLESKLKCAEEGAMLLDVMPLVVNEISNSMATVELSRELLLEKCGPAAKQLLEGVDASLDMLKPIQTLLRPVAPHKKSTAFNDVVKEAGLRVEQEATAYNVVIEYTLDPAIENAMLDADQLRDALVCLFKHGIHLASHSAAKRLRVGTRKNDKAVQLVCQDTGPAIAKEDYPHLFELGSAKDIDSIRLLAMNAVTQSHGGTVTVRSQDGVGNAFLVEIPQTEAVTPSAQQPTLSGLSVMVVDDEEMLLECLKEALTSWGCKATVCALAAEAIQKLQASSFDLIVSDIKMQGLSGIQLYDWIQANQPRMAKQILFTTGDTFDKETRAFLDQRQPPCLSKPFDLKALREALQELLAVGAK